MFKAVGNYIVVKLQSGEKKVGKIVLPDSSRNRKDVGTIESVGSEVTVVTNMDEGRLVTFNAVQHEFTEGKDKFVFVDESDILGIEADE